MDLDDLDRSSNGHWSPAEATSPGFTVCGGWPTLLQRSMLYRTLTTIALLGLVAGSTGRGFERAVILVAGQSNALNWHAAAAHLPADPQDRGILFYYETGAPPERGGATAFNATSFGKWTTLRFQSQEP